MAAFCFRLSAQDWEGGERNPNKEKKHPSYVCFVTKMGTFEWGVTGMREKSQTRPKVIQRSQKGKREYTLKSKVIAFSMRVLLVQKVLAPVTVEFVVLLW